MFVRTRLPWGHRMELGHVCLASGFSDRKSQVLKMVGRAVAAWRIRKAKSLGAAHDRSRAPLAALGEEVVEVDVEDHGVP